MKSKSNEHPLDAITSRLDQLISVMLDRKAAPPIDLAVTLWNTTDVAEYLKVSYRYASEYVVTHHTFPNALRLPNKNGRKGHPRWYASEVVEWAARYQES